MQRPFIIHPTDLGPISASAFRHALRIALAEGGSLRLVHVHQEAGEAAPLDAFPHVRETLTRWGVLAPGAPRTAIADQLGLEVSKAEVVAARPEPGLERLVDNEAPDLIVLGTRGQPAGDALEDPPNEASGKAPNDASGEAPKDEASKHPPRHVSFAETLARHVHTPALIVPTGAPGFVGEADGAVTLKNILMPVTGTPNPALALTMVARLVNALKADARLTLLHIGAEAEAPRLDMPESPQYAVMVREGPVVDAIVKAAEEIAADLIVMATEGHNSLPDDLRGDTTEQVLRRAGRPLLAVPVI